MKVCNSGGLGETGGDRASSEACADEQLEASARPQISRDGNHHQRQESQPAEAGNGCVEVAVEESPVNKEFQSKSEMESHFHQSTETAEKRRKLSEKEEERVRERESEYTFTEEGEEEPKDNNTVTPVKSWLKKHLDSVKVPENTQRRGSEKTQPLYIIPQEPEERVESSGVSSSEDEDSPKPNKKSPRSWARQRQESKSDDTKQTTGGIKVKFSKNANDPDYSKTINPNTGYSYRPEQVVKKKGRPKGVKNKNPSKKSLKQATTPKKIMLQKTQNAPQPPNKCAPSKQTTPSPPLSTTSPTASLSFGLAPALGPALDDLSRPKSKSPDSSKVRRLSESSSSGNGSSSESEPSLDDDIEVVKTVSVVNSASPPRKAARSSFEEAFVKSLEAKQAGHDEGEDSEPILEVCPEKMQGLDENDIVAVATDEEEEIAVNQPRLAFADGLVGFSRCERESVESRRKSYSSERSIGPTERSASPSPARSPSPSSPLPRSPLRSVRKSSTSSSSSSSASDSSSDESRSSSPVPAQLPIPKLKIKFASLPSPKANKNYKAVRVFGENQAGKPAGNRPTTNSLVSKLKSFTCKVDVPRLKFRRRDSDSADEAEIKLHQLDIEAVPRCQTVKMAKNFQQTPESHPPIAPIKIRLNRQEQESTPVQTGQSLFSVLEQITTRPRLKATVCNRQYKDFQITEPEPKAAEPEVFSSSLTKSLAVLTKFAETEICHNIIDDLVTKIELRKSICEEILEETIDEIFDDAVIETNSDDIIEADTEKNETFDVVEDFIEMEEEEDSSIELSDSEYDVLNVKPIVITPLRNETILTSTDEALCEPDILQRQESKDEPTDQVQRTQPEEEVEPKVPEETVPILKFKNPLKKKNPIKLVIKPIKQDAVDLVDNDVDLSGCITDSEFETKKPPIIVKIPKASLSPSKKSPFKPDAADPMLSKTASVTIKKLKILPFFQPKPTPDSTTSKSEKPEPSTKENKTIKVGSKKSEDIHAKSGRLNSSEKTEKSKSSFTVAANKKRDSKVTVLKMSGRSMLSRKEEAKEMNERKSDLERMLEDERKRKSEEVKKMKETKREIPASPIAKKSPAKVMKRKSLSKTPDPESTNLVPVDGIQKERRSSMSKAREQWVVTNRMKTPSPTPMPFVAKKSRPDETVTFSLPPGGFKNDPNVVAETKSELKAKSAVPWFAQPSVDDLFNQYFNPDADKNTESNSNIEDEDQEQTLEVNSQVVAQGILEEILESILPGDSRPASSARSRTCSGDSIRSETSSASSLERRKSPQGQCPIQKSQKTRKPLDLGKTYIRLT